MDRKGEGGLLSFGVFEKDPEERPMPECLSEGFLVWEILGKSNKNKKIGKPKRER